MRIVMMGTGTFAEPTFEALLANFAGDVVGLVTQPARETGNKRGSTRQTGKGMANMAQAASVPFVQPESINTPEGLAQLRAMEPDLLVVAAYGQILSKDVLATPKTGTINVHASLLPKYRGAAPVAYAIWKGETQTGVSIIKVTPGLDSGEILLQESLEIAPNETAGELETRLGTLGAMMAVTVTKRIQAGGPLEGVKQDPALVTKAPKLKKENGLIDWSQPAAEVCQQVRAMQPWPTAYTFLHRSGKEAVRVIVNRTEALPFLGKHAPLPGFGFILPAEQIAALHPDFPPLGSLFVRAGGVGDQASWAIVRELQPAGKKRMTAEEFLRGYPIVEGMRFGPEVLS